MATAAASMSNYAGRYASNPRMIDQSDELDPNEPYQQSLRTMTPGSSYRNAGPATYGEEEPRTPSSTGLIRLSLKKPMGIVFEPMYDPNKPSSQRGVRICDLPRTGAAALSRKLQVGDELLQINDTTVSRLTFDEIMDFIIEADPESVNLLFRRPRKETLQARQGVQQKLTAAANKDAPATVKWVDEEGGGGGGDPDVVGNGSTDKAKKSTKKKQKKKKKRSKKEDASEEDETLQSKSTVGEESYLKMKRGRGAKKSKSRRNPYETESFLDMLIDTICSDGNNVCRDTFRRQEDEYLSEDESFGTEEDTYTTYEESLQYKGKKKEAKPYVDDGTLETVETRERKVDPVPVPVPVPLGLAPNPPPLPEDEGVPAPIKELEYDDRFDHGADVSVMESLGGPSLLIEKQRAAQAALQTIPPDILEKFGLDYPVTHGMTREQTIAADPLKFYTHTVKQLLQKHEPEKVRLLDKLLAKYKGREDHLVQKLSVRYNKEQEEAAAFTDAVKKNKQSVSAAAAVNVAKERLQQEEVEPEAEWQEQETKEVELEEEESESESEYSGDDSVDGTSPAVIAQVSELLNYVYGKTSVPGQIDRVSTIMRAYEGREAVLLELLETKALIKANKEKENADTLPSFLRNSQLSQAQKNEGDADGPDLPPVTPMATSNDPQGGTVINDDISSMSGVSSPAAVVEISQEAPKTPISPMKEVPKLNASVSSLSRSSKPPVTPDKRKKKGLFGGLFGKKKTKDIAPSGSTVTDRPGSRLRSGRKTRGQKSVEGSI